MSDGSDPASIATGAGIAGAVALLLAFIRGLFTRNVSAADKAIERMETDVKNILLELRSMHDEQTRQRAEIVALGKDTATLSSSIKAAHDRIDALVTPMPNGARKKR